MKRFPILLIFSLILVGVAACSAPDAGPTAPAANTPAHDTATLSPTRQQAAAPTPEMALTPSPSPDTPQPATPTATPAPQTTPSPFSPAITGELTFALANQRGGAMKSVAVADQIAYVGVGLRLAAVDVSDPALPHFMGQSQSLPGVVEAVLVRDGRAYVGAGRYLAILDVTDPGAILQLAALELPAMVTRLALTERALIAGMSLFPPVYEPDGAGATGAVATIDVAGDTAPVLLSSVAIPQPVEGLAASDSMIYVGNSGTGALYAIESHDLSNLGQPLLIPNIAIEPGSLPLGADLSLFGDKLLTGGNYFIALWDVADPLLPALLWQSELINGAVIEFTAQEGVVYVQTGGAPSEPLISLAVPDLRGQETAVVSTRIVVQGDRLIAASGAALNLYAIADREGIALLGAYTVPELSSGLSAVALVEETAIVVNRGNPARGEWGSVSTIRLPELTPLGQYVDESQAALGKVIVAGDFAYLITGGDGLLVLDVSNPARPTLRAAYGPADLGFTGLQIQDMTVAAGRGCLAALTTSLYRPSLVCLDLTDPANVRVLTEIPLEGDPERLVVGENVLYLYTHRYTDREVHTLHRFWLHNGVPEPAGAIEVAGLVHDIALHDGAALVATEDGLVVVSGEAGAAQLLVMAQLQIPGGLWQLALHRETLFATTAEFSGAAPSNGRLLAIDLQEPGNPRVVGVTPLPASRASIAVAGDRLLVGNASTGLLVLEMTR
jgi:hypothetical protein